jgi:hypothetical protein
MREFYPGLMGIGEVENEPPSLRLNAAPSPQFTTN